MRLCPQPSSRTLTPARNAFQALLGFCYLTEQIRSRREMKLTGSDENWELRQLVFDEVLHLVAERAVAITGADGIAVALAQGEEIICRASAGEIAPDPGARLDPNSGFSGACFRTRQVIRCDDADSDPRVNSSAAKRLNAQSLIAVPLVTATGVIGLIEAFCYEPHAFNDSDVRSLTLLSEMILAAMRPEEERKCEEIALRVAGQVETPAELPRLSASMEQVSTSAVPDELPEPKSESSPAAFPIKSETERSPGLRVVLAVVLFATAMGIGLWWNMHHKTVTAEAEVRRSQSLNATALSTQTTEPAPDSSLDAEPPISSPDATREKLAVLPRITGIRHWSTPEASTVVIDLQDQVQYEAHRLTNPERIYFDLHDTALSPGLFGKNIDVGDVLLSRIRIAQPMAGVTRVVLETKGGSNFSVSMETDPYRLVVELRPIGAPARVGQKFDLFAPPSGTSASSDIRSAGVPKFRIALDAGHGGWDLGTVGREGLLEKDLVLDVARRLGNLLQTRCGADVIFTRQDDTYIPLEKRTETANQAQADLFVSIHANYSDDRQARGVETYYTNTFSSLNARGRDGSGATLQGVSFANLDIRGKVQQSRRFAATVQRALYSALVTKNPGLPNRGVKEASYVVLTGTSMPAILAEISFVSSPADEEKLVSSTYRQQIAEALYKGILGYASSMPQNRAAAVPVKSAGQ